jgi:hypothetical protein
MKSYVKISPSGAQSIAIYTIRIYFKVFTIKNKAER